MQPPNKTRWLELCAEAALCEDLQRLQELTEQITLILQEERRRLQSSRTAFRVAP